jgi:hypothetical protein
LPVAFASVGAIVWLNPKISGDEVAATVAIPLMISYLMVRAIDRLVSELPEVTAEDKERIERLKEERHTIDIPAILAIPFMVVAWVCVATGLSVGFYRLLGLTWGFSAALVVLKCAVILIGVISVTMCLKWLFRIGIVRTAYFFRSLSHFPMPGSHRRHAHSHS